MKHNKKYFHHLLFHALIKKKRLSKLTNSSQKLILSLLHQLKHVSISFDDSKLF